MISLRFAREYLVRSISGQDSLLTSLILFFLFISLVSLFQELMHLFIIHFIPKEVVLYRGTESCPVIACRVVQFVFVSSRRVKVSTKALGKFLCR